MMFRSGRGVPLRHHRRTEVLASALLSAIVLGCGWTTDTADARAHCASGQIYRVTKGVCISRSDAASTGIRVYGHSARAHLIGHSRRSRVADASRDDDEDAAPSPPKPAPKAVVTPVRMQSADNGPPLQETRQVATTTNVPATAAPASPYGVLPKTVGEGLATLTARP